MSSEYKKYIRVKRGNKKLVIQVCTVDWHGPHTPVSKWFTVKTLETSIDMHKIDSEVAQIIRDIRYFGYCERCNEYHIDGHMHDEMCCQNCAERYLGVCY